MEESTLVGYIVCYSQDAHFVEHYEGKRAAFSPTGEVMLSRSDAEIILAGENLKSPSMGYRILELHVLPGETVPPPPVVDRNFCTSCGSALPERMPEPEI